MSTKGHHRPAEKAPKRMPEAENNRSLIKKTGGEKSYRPLNSNREREKITNPMEIPNSPGFVGKRIRTGSSNSK